MTRRYAARRDENEPSICEEFESLGATVERLEPPAPDLLVHLPNGVLLLVEVKNPDRLNQSKDTALTKRQKAWHRDWPGKIHIIETTIEARVLVYELGGMR